jgi:putative aldouronate transport system substrate-binding protein
MIKRKLALMLSLIIAATLSMTACKKEPKEAVNPQGNTSGNQTANTGGLPIVKDKMTLKILTTSSAVYPVGNEMAALQELEKKTNVHLEFQLLPATNPVEKFNLIMASGDLPDIVGYGAPDLITKYGMEGAFIPLQNLIKKYAPNLVKALDNPLEGEKLPYKLNSWSEITSGDGNIYAVPILSSSNALGPAYGMRVDWLEKLGLKEPKTMDELYTVLKAFKEKDPNGNGKADEVPFVSGQGGKTSRVIPVINGVGAHVGLYIDKKDDKIKFGPVEPQFKEGLKMLNKWYKEGILESDYLTSTRDQWLAKCTNNLAGFMLAWPGSGFSPVNTVLIKENPKALFMPVLPPGGQPKDSTISGNYLVPRMTITVSNKRPEDTMRYFDFFFTQEGTMLAAYGVEGLDYKMVNGKPVWLDRIVKNSEGLDPETARLKDGVNWTMLPYQLGWQSHIDAMKDAAPWSVKVWEMYREPGIIEAPYPTLKYNADQLSKKNQISTEINTYKDAMIDKFIMGVEPIEKFDEFVNNINKAGLAELLKLENELYVAYKKLGSK